MFACFCEPKSQTISSKCDKTFDNGSIGQVKQDVSCSVYTQGTQICIISGNISEYSSLFQYRTGIGGPMFFFMILIKSDNHKCQFQHKRHERNLIKLHQIYVKKTFYRKLSSLKSFCSSNKMISPDITFPMPYRTRIIQYIADSWIVYYDGG